MEMESSAEEPWPVPPPTKLGRFFTSEISPSIELVLVHPRKRGEKERNEMKNWKNLSCYPHHATVNFA